MKDVEEEEEDEDEVASNLNADEEGQSYIFKFYHSGLLSYLCGLHRTR